ncbi:MAG: hypothetical protein B6I24_02375 [Bacteroidetes bacterium 4572_128]|nr:MAG: hypothetical protein B6I24_02375 [Bacteroidetes bacterium 4572_128]
MNRLMYFNYIEEKLNLLAIRIEKKGKLNMLDLHMHSEDFYMHLFNKLFNYKLYNLNETLQNVPSIDLQDDTNKIIIQVSATCTKQKIKSALEKKIIEQYSDYTFKFISISKDATKLREKTFKNKYKIAFNPKEDIFDILSILNKIKSLEINKQKEIYRFIKDELGGEIDMVKLNSNLGTIINILAKENLNENNQELIVNPFEIKKKISHNNLYKSKYLIEDYKIYHSKIEQIHNQLNKLGSNKSLSVLNVIRKEYINHINIASKDDIFSKIIDNIENKILESKNYVEIPIDELKLCIDIIVVDAFIRCKIFENPENYNYAITK